MWGGHSCPPRSRQRPAFDVGPKSAVRKEYFWLLIAD
jgi:hypothetical protein